MSRMRNRVAVWTLVLALAAGWASANNLQITNVTVSGRDDTTAFVQFDISWENSWRYASGGDPLYFHDAAWVFFKVLPDGRTDWEHVTLEGTGTNPPAYNVGSGTPIDLVVTADRVGMFVRRSGDSAGTTAVQNVKAVWNLASNSLDKTDKVKLQAFGVEMVYVAEGAFKVGSGGTEANRFHAGGTDNDPFAIMSEDAITVANSEGSLYYRNDGGGTPGDRGSPIPETFPKGYAAFYCMKYEITQGQYADFLNALPRTQQATRCTATTPDYYMSGTVGGSSTIQFRNTVQLTMDPEGSLPRVYTATRPDRACNWLSWADVAALTDWAGLRPMTELEFEKACRGPLPPVADEYAWGTSNIMADASRAISGTENGTETVTNDTTSGGCNYGNKAHTLNGDGGTGPLRAGIFAVDGAARAQAGASYWGIMELSGNVVERPVTVGHATGRAFTGQHGNGVLTGGAADEAAWPPNATAIAAGWRGGGWLYASGDEHTSDRISAANQFPDRHRSLGGRAVRSAPSGMGE